MVHISDLEISGPGLITGILDRPGPGEFEAGGHAVIVDFAVLEVAPLIARISSSRGGCRSRWLQPANRTKAAAVGRLKLPVAAVGTGLFGALKGTVRHTFCPGLTCAGAPMSLIL